MTEQHFGNVLKTARQAAGLTMEELGLKAGCPKSYIWQLESRASIKRASAELLNRIANALDVSLASLTGEAEFIPESLTEKDVQFFKDYKALSEEDRKRFRQVCEVMFGRSSSTKPVQEVPDAHRRRRGAAAR